MKVDLDGQTAVVIGGTSGIGRGIAEKLAADGATVVPASRTEESVEEAAAAVGCDLVCPTDVTERGQVGELFDRVADRYGGVNVLVNSAGIIQGAKPVAEIDDDEWHAIIDTNLYGTFLAAQLVPDYMDGGNRTILNVSSMNGEVPVRGLSAYGASKFGVTGLTENLALEYADDGIRVNALAPGYVVTRQNREALETGEIRDAIHGRTPLSRYAEPEEVAAAAAFMVSPSASFVTGETLLVDGGFTLK